MRRRALQACAALWLALLFALPAFAEDGPIRIIINDVSQLDLAYILHGELVTNFNFPTDKGVVARYTGVDLLEPPVKVSCRAKFYGGGAVAIVSGPINSMLVDSEAGPVSAFTVESITMRSIHAVFASDGYYFGFYEDGVLTDVLTGEYALDTTGQTEYTFGYSISGTTITLALPTGKTVKKKDPRVESCNGGRVFFEHYVTAEDAAEGYAPAITYVYAAGKEFPALEDDFGRTDGLPIAAPTGHTYIQFSNNPQ